MVFLQSLIVYASFILHPFYVSMTDINYNGKDRELEISVRIFTDDFEKALRKNCNCKVDLLRPADKKAMDKLVNDYVLRHLQIRVNGQPQILEFNGYQQESESIWSFFAIKNIAGVKKIELHNSLLHDYRDQQINMLHIKANGKEQSDKLDYPQNTYSITF